MRQACLYSVCLSLHVVSVGEHISETKCQNFIEFSVRVIHIRGSEYQCVSLPTSWTTLCLSTIAAMVVAGTALSVIPKSLPTLLHSQPGEGDANTEDDSDVVSFHVYSSWFSPPA